MIQRLIIPNDERVYKYVHDVVPNVNDWICLAPGLVLEVDFRAFYPTADAVTLRCIVKEGQNLLASLPEDLIETSNELDSDDALLKKFWKI